MPEFLGIADKVSRWTLEISALRRQLVAVPFETSPTVHFGLRQDLFVHLPDTLRVDAGFDVSPDGKRLLAVVSKQTGPIQRGIVVVTSWFSEFRSESR